MRFRRQAGALAIVLCAVTLPGQALESVGPGTVATTGVALSHYCSGDYCGAPYPMINLSFIDLYGSLSFGGVYFTGNATTDPSVSYFSAPDTVPIPTVYIRGKGLAGRYLVGTCFGVMKFNPAGALATLQCTAHIDAGPVETKTLRIVFAQFDDGLPFRLLDGNTQPAPYTGGALIGTYTDL